MNLSLLTAGNKNRKCHEYSRVRLDKEKCKERCKEEGRIDSLFLYVLWNYKLFLVKLNGFQGRAREKGREGREREGWEVGERARKGEGEGRKDKGEEREGGKKETNK